MPPARWRDFRRPESARAQREPAHSVQGLPAPSPLPAPPLDWPRGSDVWPFLRMFVDLSIYAGCRCEASCRCASVLKRRGRPEPSRSQDNWPSPSSAVYWLSGDICMSFTFLLGTYFTLGILPRASRNRGKHSRLRYRPQLHCVKCSFVFFFFFFTCVLHAAQCQSCAGFLNYELDLGLGWHFPNSNPTLSSLPSWAGISKSHRGPRSLLNSFF